MKKVYICSPYASRGNKENNKKLAEGYCRMALLKDCVPIAPHVMYTNSVNDQDRYERYIGLAAGMELLEMCDEIWVFGSATGGMVEEIKRANELEIPVRFMLKDGGEWVWPKA